MKHIILVLSLILVTPSAFAQDDASGCGPDLASLESLLQSARNLAKEGKTDAAVAKAIKTAANLALEKAGGLTARDLPSFVLESFALLKKIDPGALKATTEWTHKQRILTPEPRELKVADAPALGMKRIYVHAANGLLVANGKPVPTKAIRSLKFMVVVDAADERFARIPTDLTWLLRDPDKMSFQTRFIRKRQIALYTALAALPVPQVNNTERLIEFSWVTYDPYSFPTVPSSGMTVDFDYLLAGRLRPLELTSFIQYSLGSTGHERIVGSVRSGGSRYSR